MEKKYLQRNIIPTTKLSLIRDNSSGLTTISYAPVKIEVIEKYSKGEKVLIDGRLYITELPIDLEIGDVVAGKVIKNNPLTVSLDIKKENRVRQIDRLLKILNIKKNPISSEVLNLLLVMQKPLVKKYTEELISFMQTSGFHYSFDELKVLVYLIWNGNKTSLDKTLKRYTEIFNESFESVSEKVFKILTGLRIESINKELIDKIWNVFVLENTGQLSSFLNNKTEKELEILTLLKRWDNNLIDLYRSEFKLLKSYLGKFILQKSYYALTDTYKEFVILKSDKGYKQYFIKYEQENGTEVSNLLITTSEGEEKIIGYLTKNIIYGEIHSPANELISEYLVNEFNRNIKPKLKIKSYLRFKQNGERRKRNGYRSVVNYS